MNPRDNQIAALKERTQGLREPRGRLESCYEEVLRAYEAESIVGDICTIQEEPDRTPADFRVLTSQETRPLQQFIDRSFFWDLYCRELGRSVAIGERAYLFETLDQLAPAGSVIDARRPNFQPIMDAAYSLKDHGYHPDVLCAPIGLFVPLGRGDQLQIDWQSSPPEVILVPGRFKLKVIWSSRLAPLSRFVIFDSRAALWTVKPDPATEHRLTVAIGEPESPPEAVVFLAETVVRFEIRDPGAFRVVGVTGKPLDPVEYANQELLR